MGAEMPFVGVSGFGGDALGGGFAAKGVNKRPLSGEWRLSPTPLSVGSSGEWGKVAALVADARYEIVLEEQQWRQKQALLLQRAVVTCVVPNGEMQVSPLDLIQSRCPYSITPAGDKVVLVSSHFFNCWGNVVSLGDEVLQVNSSSDLVVSPGNRTQKYYGVVGIDYRALGFRAEARFCLPGVTYLFEHHSVYNQVSMGTVL